MISRYSLMKQSRIKDIDDVNFPDPLSLKYKDIIDDGFFKIPSLQVEVTEDFKIKPYLTVWKYYQKLDSTGRVEYDDILLDLNNIKHISELEEGSTILFPDPTELKSFINNNLTGN